MISEKQFQAALEQINDAFSSLMARIDNLEKEVKALKEAPEPKKAKAA